MRVVNNTIANNAGNAVYALREEGGTGNVLSNGVITNTIFWNNDVDVRSASPVQVSSSIVRSPEFDGINENITSNPLSWMRPMAIFI